MVGHALGTPAFHAPEVCAGMSKIDDAAVDIWALGVSFYTVIYGTLPFEPAPGGGRSAESLILRLYEAIEHTEPAFSVVAAAQKKGRTVVLAPTARLVALMGRMMDKDPISRITISEIWDHDWMTNNGTDTSGFSKEKRVYQRVSVSHFEVERAISTVDTFMVMVKIKMRWAGALKRARTRLLANKLTKQTGEGADGEIEEQQYDEETGEKEAMEDANEERGDDRWRQGEGRAANDNTPCSNEGKKDDSVVAVLGTDLSPMQRLERPEALTFKHQAGATVMPQVALTNDALNERSVRDEDSGRALEPEVMTGEGDAISVYTGGTDEVGSAESPESGMCSSVQDVNDTMELDELFDVLQKPEEDSAATPTKDRVLYAPAKDFSLRFPPVPEPAPSRWVPPVAGDGMHLLSTATVSTNPCLNITTGTALNQGKRSSMEDFVFAAASLNAWQQGHNEEDGTNPEKANRPLQLQESNDGTADFGFFAVFDGHGGDQASEYLSHHLHRHFIKGLMARPGDTERALRGAITNTEELLLSYLVKEKLFCGSTGVVCVIEADVHSSGLNATNRGSDETTAGAQRMPRRLYCANVGDSRAVLCDAGVAIDLSNDHKLSYGQETQRIIDAGGWVKGSRVCGVLNLARSFGDVEFKTLKVASWDKAFTADLVICEPEVRVVELDGDGDGCEFVIMASDGVYDVLSSQEAVNFVREALHKNGGDAGGAALDLTNYAVKYSADNVAVVVVTLCHGWGGR